MYSMWIGEDPEVQKSRLLLKLKGWEKELLELDYKIQEYIFNIEKTEADCRVCDKSGLPADMKLRHQNLNRLYNSKRYCQIEVLRVEKKIIEHHMEEEKQRYMDSLTPQSSS